MIFSKQSNATPWLFLFCRQGTFQLGCSTLFHQLNAATFFIDSKNSRLPARVLMFAGYFFNNFHVHSSQKASGCHREWADAILARYFDA